MLLAAALPLIATSIGLPRFSDTDIILEPTDSLVTPLRPASPGRKNAGLIQQLGHLGIA